MEKSQKEELETLNAYITENYGSGYIVISKKTIDTERTVLEGKVCSATVYKDTPEGNTHRTEVAALLSVYRRTGMFTESELTEALTESKKWGNKTLAARGKAR